MAPRDIVDRRLTSISTSCGTERRARIKAINEQQYRILAAANDIFLYLFAFCNLFTRYTHVFHRRMELFYLMKLEKTTAITVRLLLQHTETRSPAIAEGPRDAGVPVEIW